MTHANNKVGIIFDMDGVLSDTQTLHATIESMLLMDLGIGLSPDEITARFAGVEDMVMFNTLFAENNITDVRAEAIVETKWIEMAAAASKGVRAISGAAETVQRLHDLGFVLSVASASPRAFISAVLRELVLVELFVTYVSAEEVVEGKPAPFVFLEAAQRSRVQPENCVVIEDGRSGMIAAKRAGMKCIAFDQRKTGRDWPADVVLSDLRAIDENLIASLLNGCGT